MVSFEIGQTLKTATGILVLGALAVPWAAFAQSAFEPAANFEPVANDELPRQIVEEIQDEQSRNGPFSADLIEPLTALGLLYQKDGDRDLAAAAIDQARQVVRVNYGLHSLDEAPLIRQAIHNEEARGNAVAAWDLEQELLALVARYPNDLRTVPILRDIADERMEVLRRYLAGEFPPQIVLGCYYDERKPRYDDIGVVSWPGHGNCHAGSSHVVIGSILDEAQAYYTKAIDTVLRNGEPYSNELRELEAQLLSNSYRYRDYRIRAYSDGKRVLHRLLANESASSAPSRIDTLVRMADWDLLFARYPSDSASALEEYERAYEQIEKEGTDQASIDEIFSPQMPVVLPAFLPNPLVSEETSKSTGYIDLAFDVTKYGRSMDIDILDTTKHATRAAENDLVRLIKRSPFRPRVTDGEFADTSRVFVRYYLNE